MEAAAVLHGREHLKTITTDNGSEFAEHERILHIGWHWISISRMHTLHGRKELSRTPTSLSGSIFPKGTDISTVTDKGIKMTQAKINRRPREKLNFSTPKQEFYKYYS